MYVYIYTCIYNLEDANFVACYGPDMPAGHTNLKTEGVTAATPPLSLSQKTKPETCRGD